jgi:hypothetical protein
MEDLRKALAKGNPLEIKRFIGECVDKMTLSPGEVKVTVKKTRGGYPRGLPIEW